MTALEKNKRNFSKIKAKRKTRKLAKFLVPFLVFLVLAFICFLVLTLPIFKISKLSCFINDSVCNPALYTKTASQLLGKNYLLFSQSALEKKLLESFPNSQEIILKKDLSKVEVKFLKGEPFAVIEKDNQYFLVDEIGFVLEKLNSPQDYFLLTACNSLASFENHINLPEVSKALDFVIFAKKAQLPLLKGEVCQNSLKFYLKNGQLVLVSLQKDIFSQVDSLQLILNESKITAGQKGEIDLRYQNPIIR